MKRGRVSYVDAAAAYRAAWDAAVEAGVNPADLVVLAAIGYEVATYSRLTDAVSIDRIAFRAGYSDSRNVTRRIKRLAALDLIVYEPGGGRGRRSKVGFYPTTETGAEAAGVTAPDRGATTAPVSHRKVGQSHTETGARSDAKRGPRATRKGGSHGPLPGKTPGQTARGVSRAEPTTRTPTVARPGARHDGCVEAPPPTVRPIANADGVPQSVDAVIPDEIYELEAEADA